MSTAFTSTTFILLILATMALDLPTLSAQDRTAPSPESIERLVKHDGSLDLSTGFHGSLDAAGWTMSLAPDGSPRFTKNSDAHATQSAVDHPDDIYWDGRFGLGGSSGPVYAIAVGGCNEVYIGGRFTWLADIIVNNVARWDGKEWSPLGQGVYGAGRTGVVTTIRVNGPDVYVGGSFDSAGTTAARNIARWNGTDWSALGTGVGSILSDTAFAIAVDRTIVYVGGRFTTAGGSPANIVAAWDHTSSRWTALGTGLSGSPGTRVNALALYGSELYAGGVFANAGGRPAANIARWNPGGNSWSALGDGVDGPVEALAVSGDDIYVGGLFDTAGAGAARNIARWEIDTRTWHALGDGVDGRVMAIGVSGSRIYAGGSFINAGGRTVNRIAQWNGGTWSPLGTTSESYGVNNTIHDIAINGRLIYTSGLFNRAGSLVAFSAAYWNLGTRTWHSMNIDAGSGINGPVYSIAVNGPDIYVGGKFTAAGGVRANGIARWNIVSRTWSALGKGVVLTNPSSVAPLPIVYAVAVKGKDVYIGGRFDRAGDVDANNVAHWKGGVWSAMKEGIGYNYQQGAYDSTSLVRAVAINGDDVYIGGQFDQAGGTRANRIARWNASSRTWSALGGGLGGSSFYTYVSAIAVSGSDIYVGGVFPVAGNIDVKNIARWDGSKWNRLGTAGGNNGVNNSVSAIAIGKNGEVFVGGDFKVAGGTVSVSNIAIWNGTAWGALGAGVNSEVLALGIASDGLYAGGKFLLAGQVVARQVARWDGSKWYELGSGIEEINRNGLVNAIGSNGTNVFVGGEFSIAGKKPSYNFAHWTKLVPGSIKPLPPEDDRSAGLTVSTDEWGARLSITLPRAGHASAKIFDMKGAEVATLIDADLPEGLHELRWEATTAPDGAYICRFDHSGIVSEARFELQR